MSRVATNHPTTHYNNGGQQSSASLLSRSSSSTSSINSVGNGGRGVTVRSAAPPPVHKETVHACPLCNSEYKDPRVLPCTHTYCFNCIRDKLINNNRVTCPKCQHQVHPFDETDLNDLPRNLILSQQWRLNARPVPSAPVTKKPVTNQSVVPTSTQMPNQLGKRKSSTVDSNGHDTPTHSHGLSSLVNVFTKSSGGSRSSRSSSVSNAQPVVSNLIKIYTEATAPRSPEKQRNDSVMSTGKHDELTKIFEQATNRSQRSSTASTIKQPSQAREEAYEEMTWDSLVHGTTPVAPPFPDQWQTATEHHHLPPKPTERPISAASSDHYSSIDNLRDIITSAHQHTHERSSLLSPHGPILDPQLHSRPSTASRSQHDHDLHHDQTLKTSIYANVLPHKDSRQSSNADSIQGDVSSSSSTQSPVPSLKNDYQQRSSVIPPDRQQHQHQQDDKMSNRTSSASSSKRSIDRFPPPPQNFETLDSGANETNKPRSASSMSTRSSVYADAIEQMTTNETNLLSTERFNPYSTISPLIRATNSPRVHSQVSSGTSTPTNRPASRSAERDTHYLIPTNRPPSKSAERDTLHLTPTSSSAMATAVTSRVDLLLSDQKRLERDIEEQIKRLKYDYDDVRKQIDRKESSIHNEVKNISSRLGDDITDHYQRKQKIYADLAANANIVGTELERLKFSTLTNINKQQLWANLEQIEINIHSIRQAVEQQKESHSTLTFAEGRRAIAADTLGQINVNQTESQRRFQSPQPPITPPYQGEQTSTNITPYKYIKIDHLAALEPESIAITENNKRILLGICNKLFILSENGEIIRIIPLAPSIRGIAVSKKHQLQNIVYVSHDETVSMIDIDSGHTLDCVKETDPTGESSTFLPLGIDTDNTRGDVYVCDYRNSCVIKFDNKLEFLTQWRIFNHSDQYDEARPKLISVYGQRLYLIVEHSCKPYHNQGIAYTFSLHICDANSGNIIKIIDADLLATQRLRWPCSVQAINNEKCYILDTMTSGKYFNGHWQKHWSRVLEIGLENSNVVTELFQLDSEAATMAMTKQIMIIAANGDILFVDLGFLNQQRNNSDHTYQNLP